MPATLEAVAVFAAAIAPGYSFLSGYQFQRSYSSPSHDLYVLAQAFVISALWVAISWWPAGHLLIHWTSHEELETHELAAWGLGSSLLVVPYLIGRLLGAVFQALEERGTGKIFETARRLGAMEPPTLWDWTWREARDRSPVVVIIETKAGESIEGQFASRSQVDFSPRSPRVFLERAYGFDESGRRVIYPEGAYVDGDQIVSVKFKT